MSTQKQLWLLGIGLLILLTLSFGMGYTMGRSSNPAPIIIEKNSK